MLSTNPKTVKTRLWKEANPERWAEIQRNSRKRNRKSCRGCDGPMPFPSQGAKYCSLKCAEPFKKKRNSERYQILQKEFEIYKCSLGCSVCGYNVCGAALDFHHIDNNKERRLSVKGWKTKLGQAEIAKCILLCANHHREEHVKLRKSEIKANGDVYV